MTAVITGIGAISAAGGDLEETLNTFRKGTGNAGAVSLFPTDLSYPVFEVDGMYVRLEADEMRTTSLPLRAVQDWSMRSCTRISPISGSECAWERPSRAN